MIRFIILLLVYLCIGAVITYTLRYLYLTADSYAYARSSSDNASYCVIIGITWLLTAPFAFAIYFARYGFPDSLKKRGKKN